MTELEMIANYLKSINDNFQLMVDSMIPSKQELESKKTYDSLRISNDIKEQEIRATELRLREKSLEQQTKDLGI